MLRSKRPVPCNTRSVPFEREFGGAGEAAGDAYVFEEVELKSVLSNDLTAIRAARAVADRKDMILIEVIKKKVIFKNKRALIT